MVNERRWLTLIFALYFFLAIGYSLLMPLWEAPDEPAHYHLAWHLATYHEYPTPEVNYEAHQPRAFYVLGSWVIRALNSVDPELTRFRRPREYVYNIRKPERRFDWNDRNYRFIWGAYLLRWFNIFLGAVALWLNWKTFKWISADRPTLGLSALGLAALTPQYLHIMSSVNNDAAGTLAGALLFYLGIRFLKEPSALTGLVSIFLALLLPFLTKLTVLPVSAALLVILAWKGVFAFPQKRWLVYAGLGILIVAGTSHLLFPEILQSAVSEIKWRLFSLRKNALTLEYFKAITSQIIWTYWGKVGWLAVGLPLKSIQLLTGFGSIGILLWVYVWIKSKADRAHSSLWLTAGLIAVFTVLAVFRNGLTTSATQGRFLFPAMGPLSMMMIAGWHDILPMRLQRYLPALVILVFLSCNAVLWLTGVLPIYYQPFFD